jgi:hypothetical protein
VGISAAFNGIRRRQLLLVWMTCWMVDDFLSI